MVRAIGGDLVGMSTALEAIAAREAGAEVLGISLVTNLAAGITGEPLNHEEVLEAGRAAAARMGELLAQVLARHVSGPHAMARAGTAGTAPAEHDRSIAATRPRPGSPRTPTRRPGPSSRRSSRPATTAELADRFAGTLEFGTAGLRGELGAGPDADEPGRRHPRRRRASPRTSKARARRRPRRHRLRRPPQLRRLRPGHRRRDDRRRAARRWSCPARCRRRCWRSRSGTSAPPPA